MASPIPKPLPDQDYLNECFIYNETTGTLIWKDRPREHFLSDRAYKTFSSRFAGKTAGCKTKEGYLTLCLDGKPYLQHRIIFKMLHGEDPILIDHKNGEKCNNVPGEIRSATYRENSRNSKMPVTNSTGKKGVCWNKQMSKFKATIKLPHRTAHLGYFDNVSEAAEAYAAAAIRNFGEFANFDRSEAA